MLFIYDEDRVEYIRSSVDIEEQRKCLFSNTHQILHFLIYKR